jgi:hypothetical protein
MMHIYEFVCLTRVYPFQCVQLWSDTLCIDSISFGLCHKIRSRCVYGVYIARFIYVGARITSLL